MLYKFGDVRAVALMLWRESEEKMLRHKLNAAAKVLGEYGLENGGINAAA